jgi:hypothetical protein
MGGRGTLEGPARTLRIMLNGGMSAVVNFQNLLKERDVAASDGSSFPLL